MKAHNVRHFKDIWLTQSIDLFEISFTYTKAILLVV